MIESHAAVDVDPVTAGTIAEALRAFAKALRANQLYLPNNPTRQRATEVAQSLFLGVWSVTDAVRVEVRETELLWEGQPVYRDAERGADSLPFMFYRDGLRELEFLPGFEVDELPAMLALLQRAKAAAPDEDDLVTLLWVADLATVRYRHAELGGDPDFPVLLASNNGIATSLCDESQLAAAASETPMPGEGPPPAIVRMDDFESTLYFLNAAELAALRIEVEREFSTDGKRDALNVLLDIIETQDASDMTHEAVAALNDCLIDLVAAAEYELVAYVLQEAGHMAQRTNALSPVTSRALGGISARLSEPAVMTQLLQAIDENKHTPAPHTLEALFSRLHASALPVLLGWLASAPVSPARAVVERAAGCLASAHTAEFLLQLEHDDLGIVRVALRIAADLRSPASVPALARLMQQADAGLRTDAVAALGEIATPGALQVLERALDDPERDVRVLALRVIASRHHVNAVPRLATLLRRKEFQAADLTEKMALFEAFGLLCGDSGVATLDGLLNGRGLMRFREHTDVRGCAARALGLVGTPGALASLQRAANTKDLVVRTAVVRAARGNA